MQSNVGRETTPEERLRLALSAVEAEFLTDVRPESSLRCRADFVFPERRACMFVDGCFWHRCPEHFALPKSNASWWDEKIGANVERDVRQTEQLRDLGWTVLRVWEHDTGMRQVNDTAVRLLRSLGLSERQGSGLAPQQLGFGVVRVILGSAHSRRKSALARSNFRRIAHCLADASGGDASARSALTYALRARPRTGQARVRSRRGA